LNLFQDNLTAGQGFIAVALVYFGGWNPVGVMGGALLFRVVNSFQLWMQVLGVKIPSSVAVMLPYLLTIAALTITVNRMRQPAALNKPFERGEN
jgi:simple sugar transport system permease protein